MKRSKDSLIDKGLSNSDNEEDAKRPRNEEPRRSSRISQRYANGQVANFGQYRPSSSSSHESLGKKTEDERVGEDEGTQKRVVTEILSNQTQGVLAKQSPTLQSLPDKVQEKLLACLDIESIKELSKSCRFYEQFINDRLHVSQSLPFNEEFLNKLEATRSVVKKHVLRFTLNDVAKTLFAAKDEQLRYIIQSQLAFLHTDKLREIDFAPPSDFAVAGRVHSWDQDEKYRACADFSAIALDVMSSNPRHFMNVTKISLIMGWIKDPLVSPLYSIEDLHLVPNLKEFRLFISERIELRYVIYYIIYTFVSLYIILCILQFTEFQERIHSDPSENCLFH